MRATLDLPLPEPEEPAPKRHVPLPEQMRTRYPAEAYALFWEVPNATGAGSGRTADAVAMCLYPSRGLEIIGFEVKSARSDWLRELKDHAKAESVCRYCDRWFVIATDKKVVHRDEVPKSWGLLVSNGENLRQVVAAPLLEAANIDRRFVASLLRQAQKSAARPLDQLREQVRQEVHKELVERHEAKLTSVRAEHERTRSQAEAAIKSFERASGIDIRREWEHPQIGAIVKLALAHGHGSRGWGSTADELRSAARRMEELAASTREACAEMGQIEVALSKLGAP